MLLSVWGIYQKNYIQGCCYWQKCLGLKSKHGYPDAQPGTPTLLDVFPKNTFGELDTPPPPPPPPPPRPSKKQKKSKDSFFKEEWNKTFQRWNINIQLPNLKIKGELGFF